MPGWAERARKFYPPSEDEEHTVRWAGSPSPQCSRRNGAEGTHSDEITQLEGFQKKFSRSASEWTEQPLAGARSYDSLSAHSYSNRCRCGCPFARIHRGL